MQSRQAFTLVELLVVIGIIMILTIVIVFTLNPVELIQESRDTSRLADMSTLNNAINYYAATPSPNLGVVSTTYVSIPDPMATSTAGDQCQGLGLPALATGWTYHCASTSTYRNTNGTGWVPINFQALTISSPFSVLPVDPVNQSSSNLYYVYGTDGTSYKITSYLESQEYSPMMAKDGGTDALLYEAGKNLAFQIPQRGLVGLWNFDEGSGSIAYDSSGNGNTGTWSGTQISSNGTYYANPKVGAYAGDFDGSTDFVNANSVSQITSGTNWTIGFWMDPYVVQNYLNPMDANFGISGGPGPRFEEYSDHSITPNGNVSLVIGDGSGAYNVYDLNTNLVANNWYQIYAVRKGNTIQVYINGVLQVNKSNTLWPSTFANFNIGQGYATSRRFYGLLDDFRIYNRALSSVDIAKAYLIQK